MKTQNPLRLTIRNGHYAEGKHINVEYEKADDIASDTLLASVRFLATVRHPTDKLIVQCESVSTEKGRLTACKASLTTDSDSSD